jgi:hypothetical protein
MGQQSLMLFCVERSVSEEIREEAGMAYIKTFEPLISKRDTPIDTLTCVIAKHMN